MPEENVIERAREDKKEGKAPSTQAGEFVREEIDHVREGKHGAPSVKQAIAIGLSKARRAGIKLPPNPKHPGATAPSAEPRKPLNPESSKKRARASLKALQRESTKSASSKKVSAQVKSAAKRRGPAKRAASARKAARTRYGMIGSRKQ